MSYPQHNYPPPGGQYPPPPQQGGYGYQQPAGAPYGAPPAQYPQGAQGWQGGGYPPQLPPQQSHSPYPPPHHQQSPYPPPHQPQGPYPPPHQAHSPYPPPPDAGPYGQPQPGYSPRPPPSPGYDPHQTANVDTSRDAENLRSAMKGFGTNEGQIINVVSRIPDPLIMANLVQTFNARFRRDLMADIHSETGGYFRETVEALIRGPLKQDAHLLHDAITGVGTKESTLDDVLLGRSNADMMAIKQEYERVYRRSLESDVRGDLSAKTERLFAMVLAAHRAEESAPVIPHEMERDVNELHRATEGKMGADQLIVCQILSSHSDGQLRAISHEYNRRYQRPLATVINKEFSGHMQDALLRMLAAAEDRAMADARRLEDAMKGPGTKDRLLLNRIVRIHWDKGHLNQVRGAYRHAFKKDLSARVKGETSGDFERILVALVES